MFFICEEVIAKPRAGHFPRNPGLSNGSNFFERLGSRSITVRAALFEELVKALFILEVPTVDFECNVRRLFQAKSKQERSHARPRVKTRRVLYKVDKPLFCIHTVIKALELYISFHFNNDTVC